MYVSDEQFDEKEIKEMDESNRARQDSGTEYRLSIGQFNGVFSYDEMKKYADNFIQTVNKKSNEVKPEEQEIGEERSLVQIKSMKHLNKYCIKDSCYMLLLDNNPANSESARRAANFTKPITKRVY